MNQVVTPINISEAEHQLVLEAERKYGRAYKNAEDIVVLLWNFEKSVERGAWIFASFLSQVKKFALLSLLSTVRQHNAQAQMNMRQLFEAGVFTAFALTETDRSSYCHIDETGVAYEERGAREKAYKWLEKNYPEHSAQIKFLKDGINEF